MIQARRHRQRTRRERRERRLIFTAAVGLAFGVFGLLTLVVRRNPRLAADVSTTIRVQRRQHPQLSRVMSLVSWLGFRPQSLLLPGAIIATAWLTGHRRDARYLFIAWGASFASFTTKRLVMRPRPNGLEIRVVEAGLRDSSFPSGHVLHYVVFWGFVAYLWDWYIRHSLLRRVPVALITTVVGLVGISRVYLGHHWLTDVLGSYSLGTGILLSLIGLRTRGTSEAVE
jgi:undecaprenyl-diphosphatase